MPESIFVKYVCVTCIHTWTHTSVNSGYLQAMGF